MRLTLISFCIVFIVSCNLDLPKEGITEGTMTYEITYLQDETENPLISLMPSELNMTFKDNSVKMEVEGWMGVFKSTFVKNGKTKEAINMLKMMGKRYYYVSQSKDGFMGMTESYNLDIEFTENTKKILEYKCHHATVHNPEQNVIFDIYYTDKIAIENPNEFTPFAEIEGVLMEFQLEINGIKMHLKAKEVNESTISDDVFAIPEKYQEVEKEQIDEIFKSLV